MRNLIFALAILLAIPCFAQTKRKSSAKKAVRTTATIKRAASKKEFKLTESDAFAKACRYPADSNETDFGGAAWFLWYDREKHIDVGWTEGGFMNGFICFGFDQQPDLLIWTEDGIPVQFVDAKTLEPVYYLKDVTVVDGMKGQLHISGKAYKDCDGKPVSPVEFNFSCW